MNLTVLNVVRAAHVEPTLSCVWVATGNPRQPLACMWIDRTERQTQVSNIGEVASAGEAHLVELTA
jgi:hypothetical protein